MKRLHFLALLLVGAAVLGGTVLREPVANAAQSVISVHERGTANVNVRNTPSVRVAREPFQQEVDQNAVQASPEVCDPIVVTAGKRLTIESFSADLLTVESPPPHVFLRVAVVQGNNSFFVRSLALKMQALDSRTFAGDLQTLLFTGAANDPNGRTFSYAACMSGASGVIHGFVTGYLDPA
jgi:hypothetical protein